MVKRAVYTAITNGYDTLKEQPESTIDFICFTDDFSLSQKGWRMIYVENLDHKAPKILRHKYLSDYEQTLWIDANVVLNKGFETIFDSLTGNHIATFDAHDYHTVAEETRHCAEIGYELNDTAERMRTFLASEQYPDNKLSACTVILRDNHPSLVRFEWLWYSLVTIFSKRDQFTFNYALWKLGLEQDYLKGSVYENDYLTWNIWHGSTLKT